MGPISIPLAQKMTQALTSQARPDSWTIFFMGHNTKTISLISFKFEIARTIDSTALDYTRIQLWSPLSQMPSKPHSVYQPFCHKTDQTGIIEKNKQRIQQLNKCMKSEFEDILPDLPKHKQKEHRHRLTSQSRCYSLLRKIWLNPPLKSCNHQTKNPLRQHFMTQLYIFLKMKETDNWINSIFM
jgi:hypothetical protein